VNRKISDWTQTKVWLVGASDGIGAALAKSLLNLGATVILSSRRREKLEELAKGFSKAIIMPLDVLDSAALKLAADSIDGLNLVIYMAADYSPMTSDKLNAETAGRIVDVNIKGAINLSSIVIPKLLEAKKNHPDEMTHLSLVASVAGFIGLPQSSVYGATKAALINFGESLYFDLHPLGLDVSIVNPGFVKTRLTEKNNFPMPMIMTPEIAAQEIIKGYEKGVFANTFPFVFSLFFRFLRVLPYSCHFKIMNLIVKA